MYRIVRKERLHDTVSLIEVEAPYVARKALPGQFIVLRIDEKGERIPLTIADYDREKGTVAIIFQKVGLTTKMLAGAVDRILVGIEESKQHYSEQEKVVVTGTPVRGAFTACSKAEAKRQLGLDPDRPLVVSVWGSLGASYMNEVMTAFITRAAVTDAPFALIHSAGRNGYEKMHAALLEKCPAALAAHGMDVRPYIYDMPLVMDAADLVLCRAGASTLAELSCIGKPAILIPSPNVTNNHQERNARVLEHAGGAKVLLEGAFTADDLYNLVSDLLADPAQLAQMAQNMKSAGVSDAAERIADLVLKLADRHAK